MSAMLGGFKGLKLWQMGVLAAVLVGAIGGGAYGVYALATDSGQGSEDEGQTLISVERGDLVNQVSTSGSLVFPIRETLAFGSQGTVEELLVEEGQRVTEGQPLARLDASAVASLEETVAQSRVNLQNAEEALAETQSPSTPLDLAQAEAGVANAQLSLQNAQDDLAGLLQPTSQEIVQAEAAVTGAALSLKDAEEALDAINAGPTQEEIAEAESAIDAANTTLAIALGDLSLAQKEWDNKVQEAQEALDTAREGYREIFKKWLGIEIAAEEVDLDPDALLASWGADLAFLFDPDLRSQNPNETPPDDPATRWSETVVYTWLSFYPGTIKPTCEDGVVPAQGACIQQEMDDAWDSYQEDGEELDTVQTQASKAIANAGSVVTGAEEGVAAAEEALATLMEEPDPLEIESEERQLALALANLAEAEEELAVLLGDPDPREVEVQERQVALAQANVAEAEEELAELLGSADTLVVALREAEITSAQAALETALERLEGTTLTAPMFGIISLVNVEVGQSVNANTPIVEIVDPTIIEVDGIVDEIDILLVREGARAVVIMDALPGGVLEGTVSSIATAAQTQQGVVSYPIRIRLEVPRGGQLREGLSASASIVIREELDVLLVPLQALHGTFEEPVVRVLLVGGDIEERPVVLGNSDGFQVAVRDGLVEGEQVVMQTTAASIGQFDFRATFRQFGGGIGGGGGRGGGGGGRGGGGGGPGGGGGGGRNQ